MTRSPTDLGAPSSIDIVVRTVLDEFPGLDARRLRAAVERATTRIASSRLDTEGYQVVDMHLSRVEATQESGERATILRELADTLEHRGDTDRALVVRLAAFSEVATLADLDPLWRLAHATGRWSELPLEQMAAMIDPTDDASARRLSEIAMAWQQLGRAYHAADCLERVLAIEPADRHAHDTLVKLYRVSAEHSALVDLLERRVVHADDDRERAVVLRDLGAVYDKDLGDDEAALNAYREAHKLEPEHAEVLDAIARLAIKRGGLDEEAMTALDHLAGVTTAPAERARVSLRAAELAKLIDYDKAEALFGRALQDDPVLPPAVDGLVGLLRDRGELPRAIDLLVAAAKNSTASGERARWFCDAADYSVALGDIDRAKQLYRDARTADPTNDKAGYALVELCKDTGSLVELAPILDELCRTTDEPNRLRGYLIARSKVASQVGDNTGARTALARAVDLDPADVAIRRELADLLFGAQKWDKAREAYERVLEDEDLLEPATRTLLHFRVARCARELGDNDGASRHVGMTLAIEPDHRGALALRGELDQDDPVAFAAHQLALANLAPPEEKATRFTALGDRYTELGEPGMAREMYREALVYRPGDHRLLTKFLELVADDGDWSYSHDLVRRLIETETDPKVRARYRYLAAQIARDELDQPDLAVELLTPAVDDDPTGFAAADELEAMIADRERRMAFYYRRLEQVKDAEGRDGERLRLWDRLGALCLELGRIDDAVAGFEVGLTLAPDDSARRTRLADLYLRASPAHDAAAIATHQAVLRADKKRAASYRALRVLYHRSKQRDKAQACDDALTAMGADVEERIDALFGEEPATAVRRYAIARPLADEDWLALARPDVDRQLASLFALVARPFAAERARVRPPQGVPTRVGELPGSLGEAVSRIVDAFAMPVPPIYLDREQTSAISVSLRARPGVGGASALMPVVIAGDAARRLDARELAFVLARQLADLRKERIARLLCPRAGELAQIVELATTASANDASPGSRWLAASLHPIEMDQVMAIGTRLRERGVQPLRAALGWLAATERAADRTGFVVTGDLATCVRVLQKETAGDRIEELVWASVTEEVLGVRARLEGWEMGK